MVELSLLKPMVALLAWSAIIILWLYATRIPAMRAKGIDLKNRVGGRGSDLDAVLPPKVQWVAHNHNHLMEQPTLFYATCIVLIMAGTGGGSAVGLAWAYVVLRIAHSLVQILSNRIAIRFPLFLLATLMLFGLIGLAVSSILLKG